MEQDPPHTAAPTLTGVVLTSNGQRLLEKCLSSLSFCDSILAVDCGSTDQTLAIAERAGAEIRSRAWEGFASQFTYAAAEVRTDWFFILDQDEICSPELARAMRSAMAVPASPSAPVAYSVARRSWYFDRFMKHGGWSPDHVPRLFRRGLVTFSQDAHIHYHPQGPMAHLADGEIIHYPYSGFTHQLAKLNMYADQGAEALRAQGHKGGIARGLGHGLARFFRLYIQKRGFLDGRAGFLAAAHGSFYAFLKYVRVLEASWGEPFDHK